MLEIIVIGNRYFIVDKKGERIKSFAKYSEAVNFIIEWDKEHDEEW